MESITGYFKQLIQIIDQNEWVVLQDLSFRQMDELEGYIRGELQIHGGYVLHVAEYTVLQPPDLITRLKYRYQLQDQENHLMVRWDNAPHYPEIATNPFHSHWKDGSIQESPEMSIPKVLSGMDALLNAEI